MDWLQFVASLVWPAIVVFLAMYFRRSIRSMIADRQLKSVKAFGAEVVLEDRAERAIAKVVNDGPGQVSSGKADAGEGPPSVAAGSDLEAVTVDEVTMTRRELADLVAQFAEIGWQSARSLPFKSQPKPKIEWYGDTPDVTLWRTDSSERKGPLT
jgi:hypothetical protein